MLLAPKNLRANLKTGWKPDVSGKVSLENLSESFRPSFLPVQVNVHSSSKAYTFIFWNLFFWFLLFRDVHCCIAVKEVVSDSHVHSISSHGGKRHGSARRHFPIGSFVMKSRDRKAECVSKCQQSSKKAYRDQKVRELAVCCLRVRHLHNI